MVILCVTVENPAHSDFGKLRQMLISTHMQDLKDVTRDIHYENYRAMYIKEQMTKNQRDRRYDTTMIIIKLPSPFSSSNTAFLSNLACH